MAHDIATSQRLFLIGPYICPFVCIRYNMEEIYDIKNKHVNLQIVQFVVVF